MPRNNNIADTVNIDANRNRIQTSVKGYHYPLAARSPILRSFSAVVGANPTELLPKIEVDTKFTNPHDIPIHSTVVTIDHRRFLIVGYFDLLLPQNLNVHDVFPHLPWHGELAVFSLGRRVRLLSRPAGSRYVIAKAIGLYIRAVIEMRLAGFDAPIQLTYPSTFSIGI